MTVPAGALAGTVNVLVPVNVPVSNCTPPTDPGVKALSAASLVTEWGIDPSMSFTVTVAPGGTASWTGEHAIPWMSIVKPPLPPPVVVDPPPLLLLLPHPAPSTPARTSHVLRVIAAPFEFRVAAG